MKYAFYVTCFLAGALLSARGAAQSQEFDAYGSWMKRPATEWPKIAVVNQIDYLLSSTRFITRRMFRVPLALTISDGRGASAAPVTQSVSR